MQVSCLLWIELIAKPLKYSPANPYLNTMAECPNKAAYQFMDLDTRTAAFFNIPFKMREDPFRMIGVIGSLKQQRFITAVLQVRNVERDCHADIKTI